MYPFPVVLVQLVDISSWHEIFLSISGLLPGPGGSSAHRCPTAMKLPCWAPDVMCAWWIGPTAHSQVCRPPESLLMELRCLPCWMHGMHWVICLVSFLFASGWEVGIYWFCWTAALPFILSVMLVEVPLFLFPLFLNLHPCSAEQFLLALVNPHIHSAGRWKIDQRLLTNAQL